MVRPRAEQPALAPVTDNIAGAGGMLEASEPGPRGDMQGEGNEARIGLQAMPGEELVQRRGSGRGVTDALFGQGEAGPRCGDAVPAGDRGKFQRSFGVLPGGEQGAGKVQRYARVVRGETPRPAQPEQRILTLFQPARPGSRG